MTETPVPQEAELRKPKRFLNSKWLAFAHRGGVEGGYSENTYEAIDHAISLGYTYIELDVRVTKDGVVVVFHDEWLGRVTDMKGRINSLTWDELQEASVGEGQQIIRLEDLLERYPDVMFNIDPKEDEVVDPLIQVLKKTNAINQVCVAAFSGKRITRVRDALGPDLCTALGPLDIFRLKLASKFGLFSDYKFKGDCVQVPVRRGITIIDKQFVDEAHKRGLRVIAWTINDRREMEELLDLGIDGGDDRHDDERDDQKEDA